MDPFDPIPVSPIQLRAWRAEIEECLADGDLPTYVGDKLQGMYDEINDFLTRVG